MEETNIGNQESIFDFFCEKKRKNLEIKQTDVKKTFWCCKSYQPYGDPIF